MDTVFRFLILLLLTILYYVTIKGCIVAVRNDIDYIKIAWRKLINGKDKDDEFELIKRGFSIFRNLFTTLLPYIFVVPLALSNGFNLVQYVVFAVGFLQWGYG